MKQPLFPSTICTQSRFAYFLTVKAVVRKFGKSDGQTGTWCLDKVVLVQGGGGYKPSNCSRKDASSPAVHDASFRSSAPVLPTHPPISVPKHPPPTGGGGGLSNSLPPSDHLRMCIG